MEEQDKRNTWDVLRYSMYWKTKKGYTALRFMERNV